MSSIKIGKYAIENLTTAMYEDSKIIYREYIQNSADSIDKALKLGLFEEEEPVIEVAIDDINRVITIKDNALGIKKMEVPQRLADIADSEKQKGIDKGFRGIGRLGGLAYCHTLRFITTYKGENEVTIMTWDAKELIRMINDNTIKHSAEEVISKVISYDYKECDVNEHYFIVEMENIRKENSELLDKIEVCKYISANTPVPYNNKFIYRSEIAKYLTQNSLTMPEYKIYVDDEDIFKNYGTILYENSGNQAKKYDEIYGVEFKQFKNRKGELLGWLWYGISTFDKQIPSLFNEMRGIRLRKENIQIGNSDTLVKLFKESRGNYYFIGELHTVHDNLIPNARRDYFVENETRVEFEAEVKYFFAENLHKLYVDGNKAKNAYKKEIILQEKKKEYIEKSQKGFATMEEQLKIEEQIEIADEENNKAKKDLSKLKEKTQNDPVFGKVIKLIEDRHSATVKTDIEVNYPKPKHVKNNGRPNLRVDNLHRLNDKQRKLISRVYGVINNVLPPEMSENLIKKIEDELNR